MSDSNVRPPDAVKLDEAMARAPAGLSLITVMKILYGEVKAMAGGPGRTQCIPAIIWQRDEERWDLLVTWDNSPMPYDDAVRYAEGAIALVRGTATPPAATTTVVA